MFPDVASPGTSGLLTPQTKASRDTGGPTSRETPLLEAGSLQVARLLSPWPGLQASLQRCGMFGVQTGNPNASPSHALAQDPETSCLLLPSSGKVS